MTALQDRSSATGNPGDALVRFSQVKKSYDGIQYVVKDLNLDVAKGEFLTMLGPSGSGKTTTLMMLGGFERPTLGHILLDGKPVERLPPEKRNIGFVFQNYALFPHMTVAENVAFPLRYRGIKGHAAREKVKRALGRVSLEAMGERKPAQLSGGQQQRVALARALVFEPSLVLMDEPLGALDKQLRERMQLEIKHLQTSLGITMVYVTHDQSEALTMSDRIAVFHDGRIQQLADPKTLYNAPENRFVAGFIGENNTMPCSFAGIESGLAVVKMADGAALKAVGAPPVGADLTLSVRPENIMLAGDHTPHGANLFSGTATDVFFLGDHMRLSVQAFGGQIVTARIPVAQSRSFQTGETVHLACMPADCRLLEG
ncbi:ABC transporter ATP-binding protein [Pseudorhodobacter sp.]|uniref:ABC transporter ATP-binding protein n=1 Tax=Pseudorhodobacter sp. TaxID=1934400 RepID=UPI002AFE87E1|nr:ABC transporter ATP-binding protein [Pseudorhodobacter sp.]